MSIKYYIYQGLLELNLDITEVICITAHILMLHLFLGQIFHKRKNCSPGVFASIYLPLWISLVIISIWSGTDHIRFCILQAAIWMIGMLLFDGSFQTSLLVSLVYCGSFMLIDILAIRFLVLFEIDVQALQSFGFLRSCFQLVTHTILFSAVWLMSRVLHRIKSSLTDPGFYPVCGIAITLIILGQIIAFGSYEYTNWLLFLLFMVMITVIAFLCTYGRTKSVLNFQETTLMEHHYAMQRLYYEQLHAQQEETRAIWHDIRKYLRAIQTDENDTSFIQIQQMLESVTDVVDVNNRVVSVILNEYVQAAKQSEVHLEMDVLVPSELFVTAVDLYVLIGNTMDNALRACRELPVEQRRISLKLRVHNSILFYCIENPYIPQHPEQIRDRFHGYGLKNVRKCVERYGGTLEVQKDGGIFRVLAHLNSM